MNLLRRQDIPVEEIQTPFIELARDIDVIREDVYWEDRDAIEATGITRPVMVSTFLHRNPSGLGFLLTVTKHPLQVMVQTICPTRGMQQFPVNSEQFEEFLKKEGVTREDLDIPDDLHLYEIECDFIAKEGTKTKKSLSVHYTKEFMGKNPARDLAMDMILEAWAVLMLEDSRLFED
jgi:hypothetical protein